LRRFWHWLQPPPFEDDQLNRLAQVLYAILLIILGTSFIILAANLAQTQTADLVAVLSMDIGLLGAIWLVRRRRISAAGFYSLLLVLIVVTFTATTGNGIHDLSVLFFSAVVMAGAQLLDRREFLALLGLSLLSAAWVIFAEVQGLIQTPFSNITSPADLLTLFAVLIATSLVARLLAVNLRKSLQRARTGERELAELNQQLEAHVEQRTAELQAANQHLESFTYSVSHDLRGPLHRLVGYSQLLKAELSEQVHAESLQPGAALEMLDAIQKNALGMSQLIEELLVFSHMSQQPIHKQTTDTGLLVQQVLEELLMDLDTSRLEITFQDLPVCLADPLLLRQVLLNLLSNALKFTRDEPLARIRVSSHLQRHGQGDEYIFCVSDNGVGFDMRYAQKLFLPFQRLHSQEEFDGTGIGLALVKQILERHGGRVWGEGVPGEGAAFYFTLPTCT
jgi:signal transduction histidine kinase